MECSVIFMGYIVVDPCCLSHSVLQLTEFQENEILDVLAAFTAYYSEK